MRLAYSARIVLVTLLLGLPGVKALAAPIVILDAPRVAVGIQNLDVLGTLYDVTFDSFTDSTFVGNASGASAARNAIISALNTSTADFVRDAFSGSSVDNFGVQDSSSTTVRAVNFGGAGNWRTITSTAFQAPIAQFALTPPPSQIPAPAALPLLGASLAGLIAIGRRRRA